MASYLDTPRGESGTIDRNSNKLLTPSVITPESLQPVSPMKIPASVTPTGAEGVSTQLGASSDNFLKNYETMVARSQAAMEPLQKALLDSLNSPGEAALTADAYKDAGVDDAETELRDINQQILESQRAQKAELEALGGQGALTPAQFNAQKDAINRKYISQQADLAVTQLARQGKFDSAKAVADRAIAGMMEQRQSHIETLQFLYSENKDFFTKQEQRAFEVAQKERERELSNEEYRLRAQFDQKIRQQDPEFKLRQENLRLQNQKLQQEIGTNYDITNLSQEQYDVLPAMDKNNTTLLQVFGSNKVSAGNKTAIGAALQLARAAQDLAGANPDASFAGLYPFRGAVDFFLPEGLKREETVKNEAYINAINLQTQFWASGAALTDSQTELVMKMVPTINDTDAQVKTKLNTLVNYMMTQTAARLQTDGINFKPEQVNLFETNDLLSGASEDQLQQLREQGLI